MYKKAVHILTMKLFADLERRRKQLESKASEEAAKKRELELAAEEKKNNEKEFAKNWEESRQGRVNSWLNFTCGKTFIYFFLIILKKIQTLVYIIFFHKFLRKNPSRIFRSGSFEYSRTKCDNSNKCNQ